MLLVGIVAGTVIMVSLVWNSMKLWCRKCERDALTQPPTITYLTQDQALTNTNTGGNRLAEVPVATLNTFQIEIQVKTGTFWVVPNFEVTVKMSAKVLEWLKLMGIFLAINCVEKWQKINLLQKCQKMIARKYQTDILRNFVNRNCGNFLPFLNLSSDNLSPDNILTFWHLRSERI